MTNFSDWRRIAEQLQSDLPRPLNERRCRLLPKVLHEWSRTDLQEHLSRESRAEIRARIKKLETVKENALQLMSALTKLDEDSRTAIAAQIIIAEQGRWIPGRSVRGIATWIDRLSQETEFLAKVGAIAPDKYWQLTPGGRVTSAYLVLRDAAAIYQWLTGRAATREVDRSIGRETNAFFRFASTLWPIVFGKGTRGLSNAMKNWAGAKKRFRERSPLIVNIAMRHPTWGIFEP